MRISFVLERPTQFEAPFFRFAARDPEHSLRVLYLTAPEREQVFDPELSRSVSWGFDLLAGYEYSVLPNRAERGGWQQELDQFRPELLIVNGYTRTPYRLAARSARRAGVPTALRIDSVLWDHSWPRRTFKRSLFALFLSPLFTRFLAVGSLTRAYLEAFGVAPERIGLFPYAVDHQHFRAASRLDRAERSALRDQLGIATARPVVLCVAKHNHRESPWDVLKALARLPEPRPLVVLAGDGPERSALESYATANLPDTHFLGYVPYDQLPRLYAACDLFVHAARKERWGVSVAEALACGLPAITSSRVGAGFDLIEEGENGYRYEVGECGQLAARILDALALDTAVVDSASRRILARWGYEATWRSILHTAVSVQG